MQYSTPWIDDTTVTNARMKFNTPVNADGSLAIYTKIFLFFTIGTFWTKKEIMEKLGYKSKTHTRFVSIKQGWCESYGQHYSFGSYFTGMRKCGLIDYDRQSNVWVPGERYDEWKRDVLWPKLIENGISPDDLWNAFNNAIKGNPK